MTPERIEEIKREYSEPQKWAGDPAVVNELLAALEEAQHQLTLECERTDYWGNKEEVARWEAAKWREDLVKANKELAEAQQTIARITNYLMELRDVTTNEIIESQITSVLRESGIEEGEKP